MWSNIIKMVMAASLCIGLVRFWSKYLSYLPSGKIALVHLCACIDSESKMKKLDRPSTSTLQGKGFASDQRTVFVCKLECKRCQALLSIVKIWPITPTEEKRTNLGLKDVSPYNLCAYGTKTRIHIKDIHLCAHCRKRCSGPGNEK